MKTLMILYLSFRVMATEMHWNAWKKSNVLCTLALICLGPIYQSIKQQENEDNGHKSRMSNHVTLHVTESSTE